MKKIIALLFMALLVTSCAWRECEPIVKMQIVEVNVPVQVKATPPPELLVPLHPEIPVFISPDDPVAASALSKEDEDHLKRLVLLLTNHVRAWRVWARE